MYMGLIDDVKAILNSLRRTWFVSTSALIALSILAVVAFPWPTPSPQVVVDTFDSNLITVDPRGFATRLGYIRVTDREMHISAVPFSQPTVHVLTSEVPFTVTFSVAVLNKESGPVFPFQLKVWNPRSELAVEAWYGPDGVVRAGLRSSGQWWQTVQLSKYEVGETLFWRVAQDETGVLLEVSGEGEPAAFVVDRGMMPALFDQESLSLTIYASSPEGGASTTAVRDPIASITKQSKYGTTVMSPLYRPVVSSVAAFCLLWVAAWSRKRWTLKRPHIRYMAGILIGGALSLAVGFWLTSAPGHPFDMRGAVLWSRTASDHGLGAIVGRSLLATEGTAHGGQPYAPVTYQYPPLLGYLYWAAGKIAAPGQLERTIKMIPLFAVVAGGAVLLRLQHRLGIAARPAAIAVSAYILNPAILFNAAVWGQMDAFVALFLLLGASGALVGSASLLWTGFLLGAMTKQTGALFGLIIVVFGVTRLGIRRMGQGLPPALMIVFLTLLPALLSGVHPSATYRPTVAAVRSLATISGHDAVNAVISHNALNIWSAVALIEGVRGVGRMAFPDLIPSRFGVSYYNISRLAFGLFALTLAVLLFRRRTSNPGHDLIGITACMLGAFLLLTRVSPRYLHFSVAFTAASLPWVSPWLGGLALTTTTVAMLISMWGTLVFSSVWYPNSLPVFEPERSWLNSAVSTMLGSDVGITIGVLLNTLTLILLLIWFARNARNHAVQALGPR